MAGRDPRETEGGQFGRGRVGRVAEGLRAALGDAEEDRRVGGEEEGGG